MSRIALKRIGRQVVARVAYYGGYSAFTARRGAGGARILGYHGISKMSPPDNPYAVPVADFTAQMEYIAQHCALLSVDDIAGYVRRGAALPAHAAAVTLDDGYRDAYLHAFPVLKRLGIPATVFLPVALIGMRPPGSVTPDKMSQSDFLTWGQVEEMSHGGISFGSHTVSHESLSRLSPKDARYQLEHSKAEIETRLGKAVTGFAYPYGTVRDFNPATRLAVAEAGYSWAVTGVSGLNDQRADLFALRRTKVERDDGMSVFVKAMQGALDPWVLVDRLGAFL